MKSINVNQGHRAYVRRFLGLCLSLAVSPVVSLSVMAPIRAQAQSGSSASGPQKDAAAAPAPVSRPRVAVLDFRVTQRYAYSWWYGIQPIIQDSVGDMLVTEMVGQDMEVIERSRIAEVLKEQDFGASGRVDPETAAKVGKVLGADYLIMGSITEFGVKENKGSFFDIIAGQIPGVHVKQTNARVKIDVRMVNASTAKIEMAYTGTGQEKIYDFDLYRSWWRSIHFDTHEWWDSMLGKATRKAVNDVAKKLSDKYEKLAPISEADRQAFAASHSKLENTIPVAAMPAHPVIASLLSAEEFVINCGSQHGVKVGDRFEIVRMGEPVRDKDGKVIFEEKKMVMGVIEVVAVQELGAKVKLVRRDTNAADIAQGDAVRLIPTQTASK